MKVDFCNNLTGGLSSHASQLRAAVWSETDRLTDVILCPPSYLAPIPCCAVTRSSLRKGFETCTDTAVTQHRRLVALLEGHGVRCHLLEPDPSLPDMCFTRDIAVATPFGLIALNPAMPHRREEVDRLVAACAAWDVPIFSRISEGTIEGGDICVARDGLLLIGMSGERTARAGVDAFAAPFRAAGWDVLICPFEAAHLHLDTIFCMVAHDQAIACTELLDPHFLRALEARGIAILPVPVESVAGLGCNILAIGEHRILASSHDEHVASALRRAGYRVDMVDISQFAACGGGIHCLTQPLHRAPAAFSWSRSAGPHSSSSGCM